MLVQSANSPTKKPNMTRTLPAKTAQALTPAHLGIPEFRSRLSWFSLAVAFRQRSEFRTQILSSRLAWLDRQRYASVESSIDKLLIGKTHLFAASAGHAVNLRPEYLSVRTVVREANRIMRECVKRAHAAMTRAAGLQGLTYFVESTYEADFEDLTRYQVTSPAYLVWALDVMKLPARDQQAVRTYCEAEKQVWWATDGEDAFGATYALSEEEEEKEAKEDKKKAKDSVQALWATMSPGAAALVAQRLSPEKDAWLWLQPFGIKAPPWPFCSVLQGNEDKEVLEEEAGHWDAFGRALSRLPFDALRDDAATGDDASPAYVSAVDAWADCLDAGQSIGLLAGVLRACTLPVPGRLCDVCYRHIALQQRRRCSLHVTRSTYRTQAAHLAEFAQRYAGQLAQLRRLLGGEPAYTHTATYLSSCWAFYCPGVGRYEGPSHPVLAGKWPAMPAQEAAERLSHGLLDMVKRLGPVAGPELHARMLALAVFLRERSLQAVREALEPALPKTATDKHGAQASAKPAANDDLEEALHDLTPPGFFRLWFGGCAYKNAPADLQNGTDADHPIVPGSASPGGIAGRGPRKRSRQPTGTYSISLDAVVRDILRHRAWLDAGGEAADAALRSGQPLPSEMARHRLDIGQALRLQKDGMSLRRIGELLGVSGPAVHKAIKKHLGAAPSSPADKESK